jgi:cbb3-type cytochrome oxidase cytochrome c subunit
VGSKKLLIVWQRQPGQSLDDWKPAMVRYKPLELAGDIYVRESCYLCHS